MALPGVFTAQKKDGSIYYRSSFTFRNKHISLGSFSNEADASAAYNEALKVSTSNCSAAEYTGNCVYLSFDKYISIINLRDKGIYIKTPIYLMEKYFIYYLCQDESLIFDVDDLFYYSTHTIMKRNGYLFVSDYGMQINILSRYGIKNHAVQGRDFIFINNNSCDYRYNNIKVINPYFGVEKILKNGRYTYRTRIHINGDYIVGYYKTDIEAAIAYNKAAAILRQKGLNKNYPENYIDSLSPIEYAKIYNAIRISKKISEFSLL